MHTKPYKNCHIITKMPIYTSHACIIIASHISNPKRITHLLECLHSITAQTFPVATYLSISFETQELHNQFAEEFSKTPESKSTLLFLFIKPSKTPQMRHMYELLPYIEEKHSWILFSDDDDTYEPNRVEIFLQNISYCLDKVEAEAPSKRFVGVYESTFGKDHREQRHEFWCYGIHLHVLQNFMDKVSPYSDILDHKCCDVLFGEYLRRLSADFVYAAINTPLYHYRITENSDSITGIIQTQNKMVRKAREVTEANKVEVAEELNDYLKENIEIYLHDTYLRTLVGSDFESILHNEFKSEVAVLPLIDPVYVDQIWNLHNHIRSLCRELYDIKI